MKNLTKLGLLILGMVTFFACKKEPILEKNNPERTEIAGAFKMEVLEGNDPDPGITDLNTKYKSDTLFWKTIALRGLNKSFIKKNQSK